MNKGRKTMAMALGVLLFAIVLGAVAQICLKHGIIQLGPKPPPGRVLGSVFTNIWVFGGFFCYAGSSVFYLLAISRLDLSYAYPMIALSYVMVTFLAWKLLGESVPGLRIAGLGIILVGVVVMALSYSHADAKTAAPTEITTPTP